MQNNDAKKGIKIYLLGEYVVADSFNPEAETKVTTTQEIPEEWMALDITENIDRYH